MITYQSDTKDKKNMDDKELYQIASRFRTAIELARDAGEFTPKRFARERMNQFPFDCCDDTADLFTHYLYHNYGIDSIRIDGEYIDEANGLCGHSWQETEGWIVDLTGDQFENDPSVPIKADAVYVGKMDSFHSQFKISQKVHSCGIECLGERSHDRMYHLYDKIIQYI